MAASDFLSNITRDISFVTGSLDTTNNRWTDDSALGRHIPFAGTTPTVGNSAGGDEGWTCALDGSEYCEYDVSSQFLTRIMVVYHDTGSVAPYWFARSMRAGTNYPANDYDASDRSALVWEDEDSSYMRIAGTTAQLGGVGISNNHTVTRGVISVLAQCVDPFRKVVYSQHDSNTATAGAKAWNSIRAGGVAGWARLGFFGTGVTLGGAVGDVAIHRFIEAKGNAMIDRKAEFDALITALVADRLA